MAKLWEEFEAEKYGDAIGWMQEFQSESDRGCAVLAASYLGVQIKELLRAFMVEGKEADGLLESEAGLGTFSKRITAAFCLGLVSPVHHRDLNRVRNIRNHFGHQLHGLDFNHHGIKSLCGELEIPNPLFPPGEYTLNARDRFVVTVAILHQWIGLATLKAKRERREVRPDPSVVGQGK